MSLARVWGRLSGLADLILEASGNARTYSTNVTALAERVANMARAVAAAIENVEAPSTRDAVASFEHSLHEILRELQEQGKRSYLSRILHQKRERERWLALARRFDDAVNLLMIQMRIISSTSSTALSAQIEEMAARPLAIDWENSESLALATSLPRIPPKPAFLFGRSEEMQTVMNTVCSPSAGRVAILGGPGMGKTTLAVAVVHTPAVINWFCGRRFLVACDAVEGTRTCLSVVADVFGATTSSDIRIAMLKVREAIGTAPALLVLDNFESAWDASERRVEAEQTLQFLGELPNLSLIITMRGTERPHGLRWTRPFLLPLDRLSQDDAKQVFLSLADVETGDSDAALDALLSHLDGVPLAISLMATLAQYESAGTLLARWNNLETAILERGAGQHRLASINLSISLSLQSPRMKAVPAAGTLLSMLSLLPHGVLDSDIPLWDLDHSAQAVSVLLGNALARRTVDHRIHVLAPIRSYMLASHPLSEEDAARVYRHYFDLTELVFPAADYSAFMSNAFTALSPELDNIDFVIRHALKGSDQSRASAIRAVTCLCRFYASSGIGPAPELFSVAVSASQLGGPDLDPTRAELTLQAGVMVIHTRLPRDHRSLIAEARRIYERLGNVERVFECRVHSIFEHLSAMESLDQAQQLLDIAQSLGDPHNLALARMLFADGLRRTGSVDKAITLFHLALCELQTLDSSHRLIGACKHHLAGCYDTLCNPSMALRYYEEALAYWRRHHCYAAAMLVHRTLVARFIDSGRLHDAIQHASQALAGHAETNYGAYAMMLGSLACAHAMMGDTSAAESALDRFDWLTQGCVQDSLQSNALYFRGIVAQCRGVLDEARALLGAARTVARASSKRRSVDHMMGVEAGILLSLAEVEYGDRLRSQGGDVFTLACTSAVLFRKQSDMMGCATGLVLMAHDPDVDDETAEHLLFAALLPLHRFQNYLVMAQCLVQSAVIARRRGERRLAKQRARRALKLFGDVKIDPRIQLAQEIISEGTV